MTGRIQVIVGGQYGSEAKGHIAGYLAARETRPPLCIRVAGPNAGHSVVHPDTGVKYALRQIPVAAVTNPHAILAIGAGSEIDPSVLIQEINLLESDGIGVRHRLFIDPGATILTEDHREVEASVNLVGRIGSTGKGIGAARAGRIMRTASTVGSPPHPDDKQWWQAICKEVRPVQGIALGWITDGNTVQIEGTQGYGLGLHGKHYPQCTSSDCTAVDFLAMAQVNPWWVERYDLNVWVVFRPYPIRVAGNSGYLRDETTWEELGLEPEYTTVTKKMRRVGRWDPQLAMSALIANGHPLTGKLGANGMTVKAAITMLDQLDPAVAGETSWDKLSASTAVRDFLLQFRLETGLWPALGTTSDRTCIRLDEEPPF